MNTAASKVTRPDESLFDTNSCPFKNARIGNALLINADCRDVFMHFMGSDLKFDLLVTDPPYRLTSGGNASSDHKTMAGKFANTNYSNDGNISGQFTSPTDWMYSAYRCLADNADAYVMSNHRNLTATAIAADRAFFRHHNIIFWDKINRTPNRWYMSAGEFVLYLFKGEARKINNPGSTTLVRYKTDSVTDHPCEKPVALMRHLIENSTDPGGLVIDPFMGSGSTAIAAINSGRRFVGIELDPHWFQVAAKRAETESESL